MSRTDLDRRVLIVAVLAVLALRLATWGAAPGDQAHAARLNQTIPTVTPTGGTSTPTSTWPTSPSPTPLPTEIPSATPSPTATGTLATASVTATSLPSASPSATPSAASPSTTATSALRPATDTPSLMISPTSAGATGMAATQVPLWESTASPLPSDAESGRVQATEALRASSTSSDLGSSCLWVGLGLILILIGAVLLVRWRRSE